MKTKLRVSRVTYLKSDAKKIFRWWYQHGGTWLRIKRHLDAWKVSGWMPLAAFAEFCSVEAKEACKK